MSSDLVGATASTLCTIHCIATPFLFFASTCTKSCCSSAPLWWIWIDYAFLFISLFAVYKSTKSSSKFWIKIILWGSWIALSSFIFMEQNTQLNLSDIYKYSAALSLAFFHVYNLKYCQCESENCLANNI
tara:strand:- start:128 stop:517 length:390 start_codon:yes stop_codon:yes gene_type:complete